MGRGQGSAQTAAWRQRGSERMSRRPQGKVETQSLEGAQGRGYGDGNSQPRRNRGPGPRTLPD